MGDGFPCEQANCDEAIEPDYCRKTNFEQLSLSSQPRMADGKLVDRGLRWTTDLCALAIMLPTIRNVRHYPKGDNSFGWESHLFEPVSKTPIRAMEPSFTAVDSEPCRYHFGGIVLLPNGEFAPVLMSQPFNGKENSIELSIGAAAVRQKPDPDDVMVQGEMYFAAAYHTPYWTEAEFFSKQSYCGGAIP